MTGRGEYTPSSFPAYTLRQPGDYTIDAPQLMALVRHVAGNLRDVLVACIACERAKAISAAAEGIDAIDGFGRDPSTRRFITESALPSLLGACVETVELAREGRNFVDTPLTCAKNGERNRFVEADERRKTKSPFDASTSKGSGGNNAP